MEENKKGMPIWLIVILSVLGVCLVGFCVWYGINYFKGEETPTPVEESDSISVDKIELYNKLRKNSGGFYLDKNVTINNIEASDFLEYALGMYISDNNIDLSKYDSDALQCIEDPNDSHYGDCSSAKLANVSKEIVDNYIKSKFDTTRVFTLSSDRNSGQLSGLSAFDLGDYIYKNNTYYFGYGARGSGYKNIYTKLLKVEEDNNNIYFFDKAICCFDGAGTACWKAANEDIFDDAIFEVTDSSKKYDEIKSMGDEFILNEDYVFEKYDDKLNTYKHTFKKVNGNYYWVSSEIVK